MTQFGDYIEPKKKKVNRDAANEQTSYIRGNQPQPRQNENNPRDYDQVKVENGSGYTADPFGVLRIHNASWPERTDSKFVNEDMRNGVESLGVKPSTEWDMVSVLQKSAPDSNFAQGVCSGPTPVFVLFRTQESLDYPFAIPISEESSELVASPYGLNRILWHSEPSEDFTECVGEVLQAYVNMGEDGQWTFWKLKSDLACCGSAVGQLCDECGTVLQSDCPIERTIYAPKGLNLCGCETACGTWKAGDIIPAWWFQYLGKWVTIPNFHAGLEEKEVEVVTGLQLTGGIITPSQDYVAVVTDVIVNTNKITLCGETESPVFEKPLGSITIGADAEASGPITLTGTIGSQQNPVKLDVVSDCETVTISGGSLTSTGNATLSGTLTGTSSVTVGLSGVEFDVEGTCSGTATGNISVSGNNTLRGTCSIYNATLPQLDVTGDVVRKTQGDLITLDGGSPKSFLTTGTSLDASKVTTAQKTLKIPPLTGTLSGTLTTSGGHTISVTDFTGLTATVDLSSIFEADLAVKGGSLRFNACQLDYDNITVLKFKQGKSASDLQNIPVTISGTLSIPSDVSCGFNYSQTATEVTVNEVTSCTAGTLSKATGTVTVPTTATLAIDKLGIEGKATFPQDTAIGGTCHASGLVTATGSASLTVNGTISGTATGTAEDTAEGTATLNNRVTVSGPLNVPDVILTGTLGRTCQQYVNLYVPNVTFSSNGNVTLPVTGSIADTREWVVEIPTTICLEQGAFDVRHGRFPLPSADLTGATISGVTSTIKVLGCKECPEPEEEEEVQE